MTVFVALADLTLLWAVNSVRQPISLLRQRTGETSWFLWELKDDDIYRELHRAEVELFAQTSLLDSNA